MSYTGDKIIFWKRRAIENVLVLVSHNAYYAAAVVHNDDAKILDGTHQTVTLTQPTFQDFINQRFIFLYFFWATLEKFCVLS